MKVERAEALSSSPGAEGTDSPPHHPFSDSAEILRISGRGICNEAIFSPGRQAPLRKNQHPGRPTEIFDFAWSVAKRLACPLGKQPFRRAGRRPRLEVERVHTLSSSPGAVLVEILVSDEAGYSFVDVVSDDTGRGVLRSPTPPWGTGARGLRALSRSPGGYSFEGLVSDDAGLFF